MGGELCHRYPRGREFPARHTTERGQRGQGLGKVSATQQVQWGRRRHTGGRYTQLVQMGWWKSDSKRESATSTQQVVFSLLDVSFEVSHPGVLNLSVDQHHPPGYLKPRPLNTSPQCLIHQALGAAEEFASLSAWVMVVLLWRGEPQMERSLAHPRPQSHAHTWCSSPVSEPALTMRKVKPIFKLKRSITPTKGKRVIANISN